jgi:hypothetical protein
LRASIRRASVGGACGGGIIGVSGGKDKVNSVGTYRRLGWGLANKAATFCRKN